MRTTAREGLVGIELWEGGGASVDEPGWRGWARREGRGFGRELARGERVGGLGASDGARGGGGGGMEKEAGLGGTAEEVDSFAALGAHVLSSPERVSVGTAWSRATAEALGVVSGEDEMVVNLGAVGGGGGLDNRASSPFDSRFFSTLLPPGFSPFGSPAAFFSSLFFIREPFFSSVVARSGDDSPGVWRSSPRIEGSHCSRAKASSTTEATSSDMPSVPIAGGVPGSYDEEWALMTML